MTRDSDCKAENCYNSLGYVTSRSKNQMDSKLSEKRIMQISSAITSKPITPHLSVPILFLSAHTYKWRKTED